VPRQSVRFAQISAGEPPGEARRRRALPIYEMDSTAIATDDLLPEAFELELDEINSTGLVYE